MISYLLKRYIMNITFERAKNTTIEWMTPPEMVKMLGDFDLDPCTPVNPPFLHARVNYTLNDDGLSQKWFGRVYINPPYGKVWRNGLKN